MTSKKEQAIFNISLDYYLDGASLTSALNKANQQYQSSLKRKTKLTEASATRIKNMLVSKAKETNVQITREGRSELRKQELADIKSWNKQIQARYRRYKKYLSDKRALENKESKKKTIASGFDNFGGKLGTIGSYGAAIAVLNSVRQAITFAVTKTIEFEKAFTDLAVKSGYTSKEMQKVTGAVYDVAGATKFSTLEIVDAATSLAKLGFEAGEVTNILPNLANVAGATGESLDATAKVFGKVLNAYEFSAESAQTIADRMVQTFNDSALDLEKFNTAFSYVGAAAASTGTSFDELTASMAILSDRGVTASKIGTGLRNIFTKLGREGDTLRDILVRVNDAQLSFYEVAELVGRRAANQLFILKDSLTEFDDLVAESSEKYGLANAKQMSTFSAQWDIFMNNITNEVAGDDADPLRNWRYNLNKTMGIMEKINSMNIFNSSGSENIISNFLNANQEVFDDLRQFKKDNEGLDEKELIRLFLLPYDAIAGFEKVKAGLMTEKEFNDRQKEGGILKNYLYSIKEGDVFKAIEKYEKGEKKSNRIAAQEAWAGNLKSFSEFVGAKITSDVSDKIKKAILSNDKELAKALFEGSFGAGAGKGALNNEDYEKYKERLNNILDNRGDLTLEAVNKYYDRQSGTSAFDAIKEKLRDFDAQIFRMGKNVTKDAVTGEYSGQFTDITAMKKATDARLAFIEEMCGLAKEQPFMQTWLAQLNITCKETSTPKKRGDIARFNLNEVDKQAYRVEKDKLTKQYSAEDDPFEKTKINNQLLKLEDDYQYKSNKQYEDYLIEQEKIRANFIAKYPDSKKAFDDNVTSTQDAQVKSNADREVNRNTYNNRDIELKIEKWKKETQAYYNYKLEIAEIDKEYKDKETNTEGKRRELLDKRNKLTETFYKGSEDGLRAHIAEMEALVVKADETNAGNVIIGGASIDVEDAKKKIQELKLQITKLQAEGVNAFKGYNEGKDEFTNMDLFDGVMNALQEVYSIYQQFGEIQMEQMQSRADAELDILQNRFDKEAELRQGALESGVATQEAVLAAEERANKRKIDKENEINKKLFDAQKKRDKENAIFTGLTSTAQAIALAFARNTPVEAAIFAAISAAAIAASTAMNVSAINKRRFVPQKYAEGGLVHGNSHARGGVKFNVNGQGGYEMEGGEYIVRKEAVKNHFAELERINGKTKKNQRTFATGGYVAESTSGIDMSMLYEALSKPVRAYVTDQDLAKSETERKALTLKTSY